MKTLRLAFLSRGLFPVLAAAILMPIFAGAVETSTAQEPLRPPPEPQKRPMRAGPAYFVDARKGNDRNDGSKDRPWQTIHRALEKIAAGDTLYLRGGTYYERINPKQSGRPEQPITLRAYSGEMAVLDGGIREFYEQPAQAWEPFAGGVAGEFRSTREYKVGEVTEKAEGGDDEAPAGGGESPAEFFRRGVEVRGWFAASMIPVRGYMLIDFRAPDSGIWTVGDKFNQESGVYFGPGVWYNRETRRIHVRLAHTRIPGIMNYAGETDPRKVPMVIAVRPADAPRAGVSADGGPRAGVVNLQGVRHWRLQDVVIRGSADTVVNLEGCEDIELDHVTVFGAPGLSAGKTNKLRVLHGAFRGLTSPWESRASMKYRGAGAYLIRHANVRDQLTSRDWEFANCEFTDSHDFLWMLGVKNVRFHHNYVDNFNDDGLEIGPKVRDQEIYIHDNLISRCLGTIAVHGVGNNEPTPETAWRDIDVKTDPASGVYIYRNVFDLRENTYSMPPRKPGDRAAYGVSKLMGEHGSPVWAQIFFYHNTVFSSGASAPYMDTYGFGMGSRGTTSQRRVFNNIFVQAKGAPGLALAKDGNSGKRGKPDVQVDGNLFWGADGSDPSARPASKGRAGSEPGKAPGRMAKDLMADPAFVSFSLQNKGPSDLKLRTGSPAIDAGVAIPKNWPDSARDRDKGQPDIGAVPHEAAPPRIGINGRMSLFPSARQTVW